MCTIPEAWQRDHSLIESPCGNEIVSDGVGGVVSPCSLKPILNIECQANVQRNKLKSSTFTADVSL